MGWLSSTILIDQWEKIRIVEYKSAVPREKHIEEEHVYIALDSPDRGLHFYFAMSMDFSCP
jgi:hypothetical protein